MSLLELKNISKSYISKVGSFQVIDKLNLSVEHNQNIFLFGPSGCGKSTLLNLISGLDNSDKGEIYFNGNLIKNHFELLKDDIGIIFQDHYLISELNIFDNIKLKSNDATKIENILDYFEMTDFKLKYPNQLSNGQKQRVCVARSLVNNPKLLIADEPTSYLDKENAKLVIDLILNSSKKFNLSTIIASHDISFRPLFDKSYTLDNKSIKEC
ncbi:ATP-binding cassette domain-containing protein [Alphaproteobacteria bacterium]|jgi:ABC-type lipoprotein export system ATPase subunit|nr:ATP-binding cassette domain-containing protein [Alphaproteobacteria bacterium]